jgi:hypothetical protein
MGSGSADFNGANSNKNRKNRKKANGKKSGNQMDPVEEQRINEEEK